MIISVHNYKGFFSMILLAVCDARHNFMLFDVGQYGSVNDSGALNNADFGKAFDQYLFSYPAPEKIPWVATWKGAIFLSWG